MLFALTIPGLAADEDEQEAKNGGVSVTWEKLDAEPRLGKGPWRKRKNKRLRRMRRCVCPSFSASPPF